MSCLELKLRLSKVKPSQNSLIVDIKGSRDTGRRIMDMGIVKGSEIEVIRRAPFGNPLEFKIRDYNLTLRKMEAEDIYVSLKG
ncbi:MAG: ferrous iron transport protein A [Candidatus Methylarchaceae archaeon HK02M2]|nr:ferrous iron transport protein A [Candidatus Methylarchaceae archaeon HK02M2]